METQSNVKVGEWDEYISSGNFLKAPDVEGTDDIFEVKEVEQVIDDRNNSKVLRLHLLGLRTTDNYLFDLNKTNATFLKNAGIHKPNDLINKKLHFKKVYVTNPTTKKEVESLRILKVA